MHERWNITNIESVRVSTARVRHATSQAAAVILGTVEVHVLVPVLVAVDTTALDLQQTMAGLQFKK